MPEVTPSVDAGQKLRMVLDYVPCEACLSQPTPDQALLCSICHRLDRTLAVRVTRRRDVILERPGEDEPTPVVIPPAAPEPDAPVVGRDIILEPLEGEPAPEVAAAVGPEPAAEAKRGFRLFGRKKEKAAEETPAAAEPEVEPEEDWDDIASYTPTDDLFGVSEGPAITFTPPPREDEPAPVAAPVLVEEPPQDDFVFRPPPEEEPLAQAPAAVAFEDDFLPEEEISLEPQEEGANPWAPPVEEMFPETEEAPLQVEVHEEELPEEEIVEMELLPDEEDEIVETEIVEMEVIEDEPGSEAEPASPWAPPGERVAEPALPEAESHAPEEPKAKRGLGGLFRRKANAVPETQPAPEVEPEPVAAVPADEDEPVAEAELGSDLYRLTGFRTEHEAALAEAGVRSLSHLSGHDAHELAQRAGLPANLVQAWVHVADLVQEVGVPVESAKALVAAGVEGPRGLRDAEAEDIVERVAAFGGATLGERDVKRWKRRA